jgi:hypothetical protein
LTGRFGGDVLTPDVRHLIAQFPRKDAPGAACGVYNADLRAWPDSMWAVTENKIASRRARKNEGVGV